jgi:uncharacterized protein YjiS (DUF1127 family)
MDAAASPRRHLGSMQTTLPTSAPVGCPSRRPIQRDAPPAHADLKETTMTLKATSLALPVRHQSNEAWRQSLLATAWLWNAALALLGHVRVAARAGAQRRRRVQALRQLDDRILADMGFSRRELEFVRHGDWRFPS